MYDLKWINCLVHLESFTNVRTDSLVWGVCFFLKRLTGCPAKSHLQQGQCNARFYKLAGFHGSITEISAWFSGLCPLPLRNVFKFVLVFLINIFFAIFAISLVFPMASLEPLPSQFWATGLMFDTPVLCKWCLQSFQSFKIGFTCRRHQYFL